jgi:signal transduction histidine kinase
MTWDFPPYAVAFVVNALLAALLGIIAWRRSVAPGTTAFALMMFAVAVWTGMRVLEAAAVETWAKVLWARFEYLGIASVAALWLIFCARFSRFDRWLTPTVTALLFVIPAVTVVMAFTNDWHRLLWSDITPGPQKGGTILVYGHGPWFWIAASFNYLSMLAGSLLIIRAIIRFPKLYRRQIVPLLLGAVVPLAGNLVYVSGGSPIPGLDLTPFGFTVAGLIVAWSVFGLRLFATTPVAWDVLVTNIRDGVVVLDPSDLIVEMNPAAREFAACVASPAGRHVREVFRPWPPLIRALKARSEREGDITTEDDPPRELTFTISPLKDQRGRLAGRLVVLRDVTEQRRAEQVVRESERLSRLLLDSLPHPAQLIRKDRVVLAQNRIAQQIGSRVGDYCWRSFGQARYLSPQDKKRAAESEKNPNLLKDIKCTFCLMDGSFDEKRPVNTPRLEMFDRVWDVWWVPTGRDTYLHYAIDVTEQEKARQEVTRYAKELEEANRDIREFAHIVSHDFRSPLINIKGFTDDLDSSFDTVRSTLAPYLETLGPPHRSKIDKLFREDIPESLGFIKSGIERLETGLDAVLKLARLGRRELEFEALDPARIIRGVVTDLSHRISREGVRVTVHDVPSVVADRVSFEQIISNLLDNAVKYLDPERPGIIEIGGRRTADETVFYVKDNGKGIAGRDRETIFQVFKRGVGSEIPGEGMGLAFVKTLVARHRGRVWCESEPGIGSTFFFTIGRDTNRER